MTKHGPSMRVRGESEVKNAVTKPNLNIDTNIVYASAPFQSGLLVNRMRNFYRLGTRKCRREVIGEIASRRNFD